MSNVTIFENIWANQPHYITVDAALNRIKTGKSKVKVEQVRSAMDKEKADVLKKQLPCICFSGKFTKRTDDALLEHSFFLVLDFDNIASLEEKAAELSANEYVYALWLSPRGNGLKVLVKIADGTKHREHFAALQELFPEVDKSGVNESRACFESYDPNLFLNEGAKVFNKLKTVEKIEQREVLGESAVVFQNLLKWLSNRNDAFRSGERNHFIFKLASACCRFGLHEMDAIGMILMEYPPTNDFSKSECEKAIKSAFRANRSKAGSAAFEREMLVDKVSRKEVEIDQSIFDESIRPRDVIYGDDVKDNAANLYRHGYPSVQKLGIPLDDYFKSKRGEITLLSGIGNYGKSSFWKWYKLMRIIKFGEKYAAFAPEDNPAEEYYFDFVEMLLGCDCSPFNPDRPSIEAFNNAYDFIAKHIFYIYPSQTATPNSEYLKERFLEMIIKEKVDGVEIDPWNQMSHDYSGAGGNVAKYLELSLGDWARFAQTNNVFFSVVAHPKQLQKGSDGNYPCPDIFDIADGAMWNNKVDNFLVYHRPYMQMNPDDPTAEFHSKKIRRQKVIGKKGFLLMEYIRTTRRFEFMGVDYMERAIKERGLNFIPKQAPIRFKTSTNFDHEEDPF